MDHNPQFSMQDAMKLAQSPAGQQLLALMHQQGGTEIQDAMNLAAAGDYTKAKQALSSLLDSPEARALLQQLGR